MPSETFNRFLAIYREHVGEVGYNAELDGYHIDVADMGHFVYRWWLLYNDRRLTSGEAIHPALAWQRACDAIDRHKAELEAAV